MSPQPELRAPHSCDYVSYPKKKLSLSCSVTIMYLIFQTPELYLNIDMLQTIQQLKDKCWPGCQGLTFQVKVLIWAACLSRTLPCLGPALLIPISTPAASIHSHHHPFPLTQVLILISILLHGLISHRHSFSFSQGAASLVAWIHRHHHLPPPLASGADLNLQPWNPPPSPSRQSHSSI